MDGVQRGNYRFNVSHNLFENITITSATMIVMVKTDLQRLNINFDHNSFKNILDNNGFGIAKIVGE